MADEPRPITYWEYVQVERLLELQKGLAGDESRLAQDEVVVELSVYDGIPQNDLQNRTVGFVQLNGYF